MGAILRTTGCCWLTEMQALPQSKGNAIILIKKKKKKRTGTKFPRIICVLLVYHNYSKQRELKVNATIDEFLEKTTTRAPGGRDL